MAKRRKGKKKKGKTKKAKRRRRTEIRLFSKNRALFLIEGGRFFYAKGWISAGFSSRFKALSIFILAFSPKTISNSDFNLS